MGGNARTFGGYTVTPLVDTEGTFVTYADGFPGLRGEALKSARAGFPELFRGDDWWVPCRVFLLRGDEGVILVDLGAGPPPNSLLEDAQGLLPEALAAEGVGAEDVQLVFLTHLHFEHVGWVGHFPRARYVLAEAEWGHASRSRDAAPPAVAARAHVERLRALEDEERLQLVSPGEEIAPGLRAEATAGHTPGHTSLRLDGAYLLGDVAVHPAQLADPSLSFVLGDGDRQRAEATRRRVLAKLADEGLVVASPHFPGSGFGRVVRVDGGFAWEPSA